MPEDQIETHCTRCGKRTMGTLFCPECGKDHVTACEEKAVREAAERYFREIAHEGGYGEDADRQIISIIAFALRMDREEREKEKGRYSLYCGKCGKLPAAHCDECATKNDFSALLKRLAEDERTGQIIFQKLHNQWECVIECYAPTENPHGTGPSPLEAARAAEEKEE